MREKLIDMVNTARDMRTGQDLAERIADHLLVNGVTIQKWIPVYERLPEEDGDYLVYKHNAYGAWHEVLGFAKDARKINEDDFLWQYENVWYDYDSEYGYITHNSVTHWMPLPEPPKEDNHD